MYMPISRLTPQPISYEEWRECWL